MAFLDYFRRRPSSASLAKDRLSLIVARERVGTRSGPDYLPRLQQELLAVLAKYERIDLQQVQVSLDRAGDCDVLELNVYLPTGNAPVEGAPAPASPGRMRVC
jgi:cell division topological specificity factor